MEGIILRGIGSFYTVRSSEDGGEYVLRAQKKLRRTGMKPLVGDRVLFVPGKGEEEGWIESILPRKNELVRPSVANVDMLMLVLAPVPLPDLMMIDRLILRARRGGMTPAICVNKTDLENGLPEKIENEYAGSGLKSFYVSAKTGDGLGLLRPALEGKVTCLAGQSAVGKTSLLNALFGLAMETGGLSEKTERGRHTTRKAELMTFGDALVMDTPGFSLLELEDDLPPEEIADQYEEYAALSEGCRFQPCLHDREPGCAVRRAVEEGRLSPQRWERYRKLLAEAKEKQKGRYA
ncbi:MAG: ribosome small subunit-dependent GTPase A [Clostridia bacterium]|nr:ribosome small subunit-dependent GTPase A [Clostridia bacterium]